MMFFSVNLLKIVLAKDMIFKKVRRSDYHGMSKLQRAKFIDNLNETEM